MLREKEKSDLSSKAAVIPSPLFGCFLLVFLKKRPRHLSRNRGSQEQPDSLSFAESVREQVNIEKILLLNAGLDIAYITAGLFLLEKQNADKKMKGYGRSVILQGSFLLAFDVIMYLMHNQNNQAYFDIIKNISISDKGISVKINF